MSLKAPLTQESKNVRQKQKFVVTQLAQLVPHIQRLIDTYN